MSPVTLQSNCGKNAEDRRNTAVCPSRPLPISSRGDRSMPSGVGELRYLAHVFSQWSSHFLTRNDTRSISSGEQRSSSKNFRPTCASFEMYFLPHLTSNHCQCISSIVTSPTLPCTPSMQLQSCRSAKILLLCLMTSKK